MSRVFVLDEGGAPPSLLEGVIDSPPGAPVARCFDRRAAAAIEGAADGAARAIALEGAR
ncbi:MAG: hypothetical protein GW783_07935 [Deltaproteobacteria bacterium]|nr:hypothetical protein [Deltaproteobacteria bacterium]NCP96502.1 hypothetical protein [Deltaproteobacteria bacterium]NCS74036.1 hypothetical protein [Deltaproteobacteria bacterium]